MNCLIPWNRTRSNEKKIILDCENLKHIRFSKNEKKRTEIKSHQTHQNSYFIGFYAHRKNNARQQIQNTAHIWGNRSDVESRNQTNILQIFINIYSKKKQQQNKNVVKIEINRKKVRRRKKIYCNNNENNENHVNTAMN